MRGRLASADHVTRTNPELVRRYGDLLWLDPGEPAVRSHVLDVITDVVRRYDIDAVHLDAVILADPHPLLEAERRLQPGNGSSHIGIDEHRCHGCRRRRAVRQHRRKRTRSQKTSSIGMAGSAAMQLAR